MPSVEITTVIPDDAVLVDSPITVLSQSVSLTGPPGPSAVGSVASVFGRTGVVVADPADYAADYDALGAAAAAQAAAIAASQPLDADLTAIAALTTTSFGRALLTQADAAALRTTAGLGTAATHPATDFDSSGAAATAQAAAIAAAATDATTKANAAQAASQPLDSDLTAIAALTTTSFGRSFLALADAAAGRTLLGLGTLATQSGTFSGTSSGTNTGDQTLPTTLPPNGTAGGVLTGTYPNPSGLAATTVTAAAYGSATSVPTFTVGADGRLTAAGTVSIAIPESAVTNLVSDLALKAPLASPALTGSPTVNGNALSGANTGDETGATIKTKLGVTTLSGSNTGDQTISITGDVTASGSTGALASTVGKLNGTSLAGLATGLLKNTTGTGVPSIAVAADIPNIAESQVTNLTTDLAAKSVNLTRQAKTANYTAVLGDEVACDTSGGTFTVTLPAASGGKGKIVVKWVAGATAPSIAVSGSDHFDTSTGSTGGSFTLPNQAATYDSDGTSIWTVRNSFALSTLDTRFPLVSALAGLSTGLVKVTTGTGALTAAVAADVPNLAASQITSGVFAIGRLATGTPDGTKFVRDDGTLVTPSGGSAVPTNYLAPTGALYETFPRQFGGSPSAFSTVSGTLRLVAIALPAGLTIGHIAFLSAGGQTTPTHWWFGLYDSSRLQLAVTADQTTTVWSGTTVQSLAIATTAGGAASTFTTTYSGLYYLGCLQTATTCATLNGTIVNFLSSTAPIVAQQSDTGQTTPPAFAHTATSGSSSSQLAYAYVAA